MFKDFIKSSKFLSFVNDVNHDNQIQHYSSLIKNKYKKIVVIGFGGSFSAAKAIINILLPAQTKIEWVYFLDKSKIDDVLNRCDSDTLILFISKSGETVENKIILDYLVLNTTFHKAIITTLNKNTLLSSYKYNLIIEHPDIESGRFSFTTIICFLLLDFVGVDYYAIKKGFNQAIATFQLPEFIKHKDMTTKVYFSYSYNFEAFNLWLCQLFSESLSKKNKDAKSSITPIGCIGTRDQHSVLEGFLSKAKETYITFILPLNMGSDSLTLALKEECYLTKKACDRLGLKNRLFEFNLNQFELGELIMRMCLEILYVGYINNINPYTQPFVDFRKTLS